MCGTARRGDHLGDPEPRSTGRPSRSCERRDGRWWWWGSPEAPAHHADRHTGPRPLDGTVHRRAGGSAAGTSVPTSVRCSPSTSWSTPSGPGPSWRSSRGAIGWFMVLRRQSFAGHTLAVVSFPGAAGASGSASARLPATSPGSIAGGAGDRHGASLPLGTGPERGVGGDRDGPGLRPGLRRPVRQPLRRIPRQPHRPAVRHVPRDLRRPGGDPGAWWRWSCWRSWPSWPAPCSSPPSTPTWPPPGGCRSRALSVAFLLLLGCAAAEVSQITGALLVFALLVMPAAAAQQITARPALSLCAHRGPGAGHHLGLPAGGLLLGLSGGLLRLDLRFRRLRVGRRRPRPGHLVGHPVARFGSSGSVRRLRCRTGPDRVSAESSGAAAGV